MANDNTPRKAYVGIDVAIAKKKRLPIVVCVHEKGVLVPLELKANKENVPPAGFGNVAAIDNTIILQFSRDTLAYLASVEQTFKVSIRRIAIDAPKKYRGDNEARRHAELAMDERHISCFGTPSQSEFGEIKRKVKDHLRRGGGENRLPHANQLWMLAGFSLFAVLGKSYECIEVFPQAIVHTLNAQSRHKRTITGLESQLIALSKHTGWPIPGTKVSALENICFGSRHDKLDAYMSAWVASLPVETRTACGTPPDDVIWIPNTNHRQT